MAFLFNWNGTFLSQPADLEDAALGAGRIRDSKYAVGERMEVDHIWGVGATDGIHKQVTMGELSVKPVVTTNQGAMYVKDVGGVTAPYFEDDTGAEHLMSLMDTVYPVGSIYINASVSTNPSILLGFGTWVAYGTGRALVAIDTGNTLMDTVGETFGSADAVNVAHSHAITDPGHSHTIWGPTSGSLYGQDVTYTHSFSLTSSTNTTDITINSAGESGTNKNYQPSIAVYMWKRTA